MSNFLLNVSATETWPWNVKEVRNPSKEMSYLRAACGTTGWNKENNEVYEGYGMAGMQRE